MLDTVMGWGTPRGLLPPDASVSRGSRERGPLQCHRQGWWQRGDEPQFELVLLLLGTATGDCTSSGRSRTGSVAMGQEEEEEAAVGLSFISEPHMSQEDPPAAREGDNPGQRWPWCTIPSRASPRAERGTAGDRNTPNEVSGRCWICAHINHSTEQAGTPRAQGEAEHQAGLSPVPRMLS